MRRVGVRPHRSCTIPHGCGTLEHQRQSEERQHLRQGDTHQRGGGFTGHSSPIVNGCCHSHHGHQNAGHQRWGRLRRLPQQLRQRVGRSRRQHQPSLVVAGLMLQLCHGSLDDGSDLGSLPHKGVRSEHSHGLLDEGSDLQRLADEGERSGPPPVPSQSDRIRFSHFDNRRPC